MKGTTGYTLTTLANFTGPNLGAPPLGTLVADSAGDLFGTSASGEVYELVKGPSGYTLVALANFGVLNPTLLIDAAGDVFGTTPTTVFELSKTLSGYTPITLATFASVASGSDIQDGLYADAFGDLFGENYSGGGFNATHTADAAGNVFELTNTGFVVASTTPLPEPASAALLLGGLIALAARRRTAAS